MTRQGYGLGSEKQKVPPLRPLIALLRFGMRWGLIFRWKGGFRLRKKKAGGRRYCGYIEGGVTFC